MSCAPVRGPIRVTSGTHSRLHRSRIPGPGAREGFRSTTFGGYRKPDRSSEVAAGEEPWLRSGDPSAGANARSVHIRYEQATRARCEQGTSGQTATRGFDQPTVRAAGSRGGRDPWRVRQQVSSTEERRGGADEPDCKPDPVSVRASPRRRRPSIWKHRCRCFRRGPTFYGRADGCGLPDDSGGQPSDVVCLALLRVGFTEPHRSPGTLVVSYTTVSPLPPGPRTGVRGVPVAVCSLWHCPAGHPGWVLPTTLPCGVRTFLDGRRTVRRGRPSGSSALSP
jgi:hypothetical protein